MFKNIFGGKVLIPFGDWSPTAKWVYQPNGSVWAHDPGEGTSENFGKFTKEGFQKFFQNLLNSKKNTSGVA